ncbi:hypothetical protein ACQPTN_29765 [Bradyrhizobium sp. 13971]
MADAHRREEDIAVAVGAHHLAPSEVGDDLRRRMPVDDEHQLGVMHREH